MIPNGCSECKLRAVKLDRVRQLLLTAGLLLPLALDTFAVGAALGVAGLEPRDRLRVALVFTIFEAGMPIAGMFAGRAAGALIGSWADYIGIGVLLAAGILLLRPARDDDGEERHLRLLAHARGFAIFSLGLSISLDELTIGLSAGLLGLSIGVAVIWIGVQAFVAAQAGLRFGARVGEALRERSEQVAGVALLLVAFVLLALKVLKL